MTLKTWGLASALFLTLVGPAAAVPTIKLDDPLGPGGTITWAGHGHPIVGDDIPFQTILGLDTARNPGVVLPCQDCLLDFQTAPAMASSFDNIPLIVANPGGVIEIPGKLAGTFAGNPVQIIDPEGRFQVFSAVGVDVKDLGLVDFYGLLGPFAFALSAIQTPQGLIVNSDLNNVGQERVVPPPPPVPWPGSWALLLAGLGLAVSARGVCGRP
jgi:hypothetical protein